MKKISVKDLGNLGIEKLPRESLKSIIGGSLTCSVNEHWSDCISSPGAGGCLSGCECDQGYIRCNDGTCVRPEYCDGGGGATSCSTTCHGGGSVSITDCNGDCSCRDGVSCTCSGPKNTLTKTC